MDKHLLDLYTDYLLASFGPTTATGLARLRDGAVSHAQITRFRATRLCTSADLWQGVKPTVRLIHQPDGVLIMDDPSAEQPATDARDLLGWHVDHSQDRPVTGSNCLSTRYCVNDGVLPVAFAVVTTTEAVLAKQTGKAQKQSAVTKHAH